MKSFLLKTLAVVFVISVAIYFWPSQKTYTNGAESTLDPQNIEIMNEASAAKRGNLVRMFIPPEALAELAEDDPIRKKGITGIVLEVQDAGLVISDHEGDTFWCDRTLNIAHCEFMETRNLNSPAYTDILDRAVRQLLQDVEEAYGG